MAGVPGNEVVLESREIGDILVSEQEKQMTCFK